MDEFETELQMMDLVNFNFQSPLVDEQKFKQHAEEFRGISLRAYEAIQAAEKRIKELGFEESRGLRLFRMTRNAVLANIEKDPRQLLGFLAENMTREAMADNIKNHFGQYMETNVEDALKAAGYDQQSIADLFSADASKIDRLQKELDALKFGGGMGPTRTPDQLAFMQNVIDHSKKIARLNTGATQLLYDTVKDVPDL